MKQKIVFFGSGWYTIPVIKKLIPMGLDLVVTTEKNPNSNFLKFCNENSLKTITAEKASDLINHKSIIINHSCAVLASYGALIPDEIINLFPNGIINIHPSLLPKYKGPSPIQYQILNGEEIVGVTIIKLDDQIDHGPILSQKPYKTQGSETSEDLLSILFEMGGDLVVDLLKKLESEEKWTETQQDHSKESWSYKLEKNDGLININSPEFKISNLKFKINDMIRAYYPWPGVWFRYTSVIPDPDPGTVSSSFFASETKQSRKVSRHPVPDTGSISSKLNGKIIKLLPENRIQVEGKKPMNYKDFLNGFGSEGQTLLKNLNLK